METKKKLFQNSNFTGFTDNEITKCGDWEEHSCA